MHLNQKVFLLRILADTIIIIVVLGIPRNIDYRVVEMAKKR